MNYDELPVVLEELQSVQGNEQDEREKSRECTTFCYKKDGQWEQKIFRQWGALGRPRYTYDRLTPIIDSIVGELEQNEFAATVTPGGGQATKEVAITLDGLVRSIQNWSDASFIYKKIARKLAVNGFDCCRVVSDYRDDESFDQDLIIKYVNNSIDRVWFDPNSENQDRSDAEWVIVLQALMPDDYEKRWPDGSKQSVDTNRNSDTFQSKRETITVGEILYKKRTKKMIVQMNNGSVYDKEEAEPILDELAARGITVVKEREIDSITVHSRIFDGQDWLEDEKPTPFSKLPVVPFYHCFEIIEDKITWRRIVERLMDAQRILNYSESRKIEEGALAPRKKLIMTKKHAEGNLQQISQLNTSPDPVLFITPDKDAGFAPYETGGPTVNMSLQETSISASQQIEAGLGMYAANMAKNPGVQSGVAIELQQNKGDTGNTSFYVDMAKGITYLCEVLLDGASKVYDTKRDVLLMNADGSQEAATLNEVILDEQTQAPVTVNDLNGTYGVVCSMGAMFRNRAEAANSALLEIGKVAPEAFSDNLDTFLRNQDAPGMDAAADRIRSQLFKMGKIPEDQMTDEELQQMQQMAQQQQGPSPEEMAGQGALLEGQASLQNAQNKQTELQIRAGELQIKADKQKVDTATAISNIENKDAATQKLFSDILNTDADTLNKLREAMGADAIVNENAAEAYDQQAEIIDTTQDYRQ